MEIFGGNEAASLNRQPLIVLGVTHPQSCLLLSGRVRGLLQAGFRVRLVSSPGRMLDRFAAVEGIETDAVTMRRGISPLLDLIALLRLWWLLARLRPDLTEFSTPKAGLLGNLAALLAGVPARIYFLRGLKLETSSGLRRRILLAAERLASWSAHHVLCNSPSLQAKAVAMHLAPTKKFRRVGDGSSNGVDTRRFAPGPCTLREKVKIAPDAPVIGFVGRLTRDKGIPELIEAFESVLRSHPRARLLLVGWFDTSEDALDPEMRRAIENHPAIVCTGFVPDAAPWYRAMDMMVLPTLREGFPNAVLEAAASGLPVITTLATGARDAVIPEVTGLLVPPGYPEAICEAILQLIGDEPRRRTMGTAARRWAIDRFSEERVMSLTVALYREIMSADAGIVPSEAALAEIE
ncbi:glycosyltransferase [Terracidiphilus sp.]|jgi:glycosyltransferase involved in cell wall biosynthesis|uniref:glycosyltransferase n=1 Tax=Terracidiphilus sp. TaxID=1964191 RepID=UPI003C1A21A9